MLGLDGERSLRRSKSEETLVKASSDTDAQIVCYTGFRAKDKPNHLTAGSLPSFLQDSWS